MTAENKGPWATLFLSQQFMGFAAIISNDNCKDNTI